MGRPALRTGMLSAGRWTTSERADALLRELDLDGTFRASRWFGYAYVRVVDIEHPNDLCPDWLVRASPRWPDWSAPTPTFPTPRPNGLTELAIEQMFD